MSRPLHHHSQTGFQLFLQSKPYQQSNLSWQNGNTKSTRKEIPQFSFVLQHSASTNTTVVCPPISSLLWSISSLLWSRILRTLVTPPILSLLWYCCLSTNIIIIMVTDIENACKMRRFHRLPRSTKNASEVGIAAQRDLCSSELLLTSLLTRAFDRFLFADSDMCSGVRACIKVPPGRGHHEASRNPVTCTCVSQITQYCYVMQKWTILRPHWERQRSTVLQLWLHNQRCWCGPYCWDWHSLQLKVSSSL